MHGGVVIMGTSTRSLRSGGPSGPPIRLRIQTAVPVAFALSLLAAPAFAQSDLSGTWAARNQQEQLIRAGSGPRLVDYTGVFAAKRVREMRASSAPKARIMSSRTAT